MAGGKGGGTRGQGVTGLIEGGGAMTNPDDKSMDAFLERLYARRAEGIKLGLDVTRALAASLGDPQRKVPAIHVAGTNGKGSVCAMLHAMLCAAGCRAALYTSPHLVHFRERFRIGNEEIDDRTLMALLEEVETHAADIADRPGLRQPTFFEFTTAAAFAWFAREGAEVAVLETGLGGALDSTNIVDPLVSVITAIDIDHTGFLGRELGGIAREKAGIIKPGRPVVCAPQAEAAAEALVAAARERKAPLLWAEDLVSVRRKRQDLDGQVLAAETAERRYPPLRCPLLGRHQIENVAVALAAVEALSTHAGLLLPEAAVRDGLAAVRWPARGQVLQRDPLVLLDAAHNPSGANVLRKLLDEIAPHRPCAWVISFSRDKDAGGILRVWAPRVGACWVVPMRAAAGMPVDRVAEHARGAGLRPEIASLEDGLRDALAWARAHNGMVMIAGSVYLAGDVLARGAFRDTD
jgi:dihydrofolate synthase / folylpolyglutamate synthase